MISAVSERFDGSGYPDGLSGGADPDRGRVLRVCIAFAAMTRSGRTGRRAVRGRRWELRRRESDFDPGVVEALAADLAEEGTFAEPESPRVSQAPPAADPLAVAPAQPAAE